MGIVEPTSLEQVESLIAYHNSNSTYVVLDCETTGLNPHKDTILVVVLSGRTPDEIWSIPAKFIGPIKELRRPVVAHNFKFDFNMLYRAGIDLRIGGLMADTMLLDHLLDENADHRLDDIVQRRYQDNYKEVFWGKYEEYTDAPRAAQLDYECKDVYYAGKIYSEQLKECKLQGIPETLIKHVHDLALVLYQTELDGLRLDLPYLEQMGTKLSQDITKLVTKLRENVIMEVTNIENQAFCALLASYKTDKGRSRAKREVFNFDSSQQLAKLLYDELHLPVQVNKKRKRTCDDTALETLESAHRIIPDLREYRGHQKVYTSFIEGSLKKMQGGRVYPSFNVNGTVTGRISSSNPNMQQLPKEGGVRGIYIPEEGYCFVSCDYSQLEVTLAAHFSRDTNLLRIVYEGASQHDITAKGLSIDRDTAKTINFALQYGAGVKKIQTILGSTEAEAQQALDKYWETYSGLRDFIKRCHTSVDKGEPLVNPFGRLRRFPISDHDSHWDRERMKRQAANSLIQGTGADLTDQALYLVNTVLLEKGLGKALFPVHDEILISAKRAHAEEASDLLQEIMISVGKEIKLSVPLAVSCSKPMLRWAKS